MKCFLNVNSNKIYYSFKEKKTKNYIMKWSNYLSYDYISRNIRLLFTCKANYPRSVGVAVLLFDMSSA